MNTNFIVWASTLISCIFFIALIVGAILIIKLMRTSTSKNPIDSAIKKSQTEPNVKMDQNYQPDHTIGYDPSRYTDDTKLYHFLISQLEYHREQAAKFVRESGKETMIEELMKTLADESQTKDVRTNSAQSLGSIGNEMALDLMLQIALDEKQDTQIRKAIIANLGNFKVEKAFDVLIDMLNYESPYTYDAVRSLEVMNDVRAWEPLLKLLDSNIDDFERMGYFDTIALGRALARIYRNPQILPSQKAEILKRKDNILEFREEQHGDSITLMDVIINYPN